MSVFLSPYSNSSAYCVSATLLWPTIAEAHQETNKLNYHLPQDDHWLWIKSRRCTRHAKIPCVHLCLVCLGLVLTLWWFLDCHSTFPTSTLCWASTYHNKIIESLVLVVPEKTMWLAHWTSLYIAVTISYYQHVSFIHICQPNHQCNCQVIRYHYCLTQPVTWCSWNNSPTTADPHSSATLNCPHYWPSKSCRWCWALCGMLLSFSGPSKWWRERWGWWSFWWLIPKRCIMNHGQGLQEVFKGSVHRTTKNCRIELNWTTVWSIFQLQLPEFGLFWLPVAEFQKYLKAGFNQLQPVEWSHALHTLVATFIIFNWVFGSSKMVKNWEKYNQIHFCLTCIRMTLILTHSNFYHFGSFNFWIFQFQVEKYAYHLSMYGMHHRIYSCHNKICSYH